MSTLVSCPQCGRNLKVAPASVGKSVKCPCGSIFKARPIAAEAPAPAAPAADTLLVTCDGCQTRLKVPASARGRKMKCSKCGTMFVVGAAPAPVKAPPPFLQDDDEPAPRRSRADDDLPPFLQDDEPAPRKKVQPIPIARDEEEPRPSKQPAPPAPQGRGCGCVLNLLVFLIVLSYVGAFLPLYLGYIEIPIDRPNPPAGRFHLTPPKVDNAVQHEVSAPGAGTVEQKVKDAGATEDKKGEEEKGKNEKKDGEAGKGDGATRRVEPRTDVALRAIVRPRFEARNEAMG